MPLNQELTNYLAQLRQLHPTAEWVCLNAELCHWSLGLSRSPCQKVRRAFNALAFLCPEFATGLARSRRRTVTYLGR